MDQQPAASPANTLSAVDVTAIVVGVVVGASVFETPAIVAESAGSSAVLFGVWLLGGGISLVGALCYAELASAYPHAGGDYHYLQRAFGEEVGFLFAWARLVVIQTGSIALLAFVFGDYATQLWSLGPYSPSIYAASAVALFTATNAVGVRVGASAQWGLTLATIGSLVVIIIAGLVGGTEPSWTAPTSGVPSAGAVGGAMVFVLLTYGGWNEAAYVSGEMTNPARDMVRALVVSIGTITALYLLVNWAYLRGLGLEGMAGSEAVAAELMRTVLGDGGAQLLSLLIVVEIGRAHV